MGIPPRDAAAAHLRGEQGQKQPEHRKSKIAQHMMESRQQPKARGAGESTEEPSQRARNPVKRGSRAQVSHSRKEQKRPEDPIQTSPQIPKHSEVGTWHPGASTRPDWL